LSLLVSFIVVIIIIIIIVVVVVVIIICFIMVTSLSYSILLLFLQLLLLGFCDTGYECVFVKDLAYFLGSRPHPLEDLPQGYVHTFLIRNPQKTVLSQYKLVSDKERAGKH
jgi:energy-coupling factor transporter transmembrane protein EcfT